MNALSEQNAVHVVIAIIQNHKQEVFVCERKSDAHLGGLLEFPGGKVEENESPVKALQRELAEELNIDILSFVPLIQIPYTYPDRKILLDAYIVKKYKGNVSAQEGQKIYWKKISSLNDNEFPSANYGVIRALQLPKVFPVTPNYSQEPKNFLMNFEEVVSDEATQIIQFRSHELEISEYVELVKQCIKICKKYHVKLILNRELESTKGLDVSGVHLTSEKLLSTKKRLLSTKYLVGASCHSQQEVNHANTLGLDYVFIGPVIEKNSSEICKTLTWKGFAEMTRYSLIPAYAIGGLKEGDVDTSISHGGQGIAAIRDIWPR